MAAKKTSNTKNLNDLKNYLKTKAEQETKETKLEPWTEEDANEFYNKIVNPAYNILKTEMQEFNFETVNYTIHVKKAVFKVADTLTHFFFRIELDPSCREIRIYYVIKHRLIKRAKLVTLNISEHEKIYINEIEKVNKEYIISLFTKWFIKKDKLIIDYRKRAELED